MSANNSEQIKTGLQYHQTGRLQEAEAIYRSILQEQPRHPDALNLLGILSLQVGKSEAAAELFERAIAVKPDDPEFHNMCGEAYRILHKYDLAIQRYERAIALRPNFAGALTNLGNTFKEQGRMQAAIASYERSIDSDPNSPLSYNNLAIVLKELGRLEEAIAHHKKAIALVPNYAEAHSSLGNALLESGQPEEAISHHKKALALRPDFAEAHSNLGNAFRELGQYDDAITHYNKALEMQPGFALAHYNLGIALDELGRPEEAVECYEKALTIDPEYAEAHNNLANALDELGRQEDAASHYKQAVTIKPDYAEAHRNLTRLRPAQAQEEIIEQILQNPGLPTADAIHCHFALGNIHHDAKSFDEAFEHFDKANRLKRQTVTYDANEYSAFVDRLINTYSVDYFEGVTDLGSESELPLFIVGMPRSGTTLVEQIVSSHPEVHGAGELTSFGRFEKAIAKQFSTTRPYPECVSLIDEALASAFSAKYLDELRSYSHGAKRVTDKMPSNFARIGLIKTLFPKARIIHCQRNALDTCTSNYLHYFATGNEFSFDQGELAHYYLDYERLMAHWDSLFSSQIYSIRYEELLANQEETSRQLIDYIGLQWDDRCLDFHKNERVVHTFSSMQVRQPIYTHAVNRWKHYEEHLTTLLEILPSVTSKYQ